MASSPDISQVLRQRRMLVTVLWIAAGLAAWFILRDVVSYTTFKPESYTDYYWPRRFGLALHVGAGTVALTTGLLQLWLGATGRTRRLHRYLGRVYLIGVLCGSSAGFYLAATIPPPGGAYATGLVGLNLAWAITTLTAYSAIRLGEVRRHREWMVRSYVVTFGFVSLRLIELVLARMGMNENDRFGVAAWLCWTAPLLLTEIILRRNRHRR